MPRPQLSDGELVLRAVEPRDIESIRRWRNAQMEVLRQSEIITTEQQQRYFAEHVWPDKLRDRPGQILLAIERHDHVIGYGGLVHCTWAYGRAEISFLLQPDLESQAGVVRDTFARFLRLIQRLAFCDLGLHKLVTETYEHRVIHLDVLESAGHRFEGRLREHVVVLGQRRDSLLHGMTYSDWSSDIEAGDTACLVTSASRKVPLVRALQVAGRRLGNRVRVICGDTDPLVASRFVAEDFMVMNSLCDDELDHIVAECRSRSIVVVVPTRDGELDFWARHRDAFAEAGIHVIVSSPEAIARCRDKLAFARFGAELNLPIIAASEDARTFAGVSLVVKERFGAGSRGIGLDLPIDDALAHARKLQQPIFQPFVQGPEITVDGWIDRAGVVVGVVLRRRDRVVSGESQVTTTFSDHVLEAQAVEVLTALDLRGPVVLQAIVVDGGLRVIECNPRFGGASTASIAVGLDSLYWSLCEATGESVTPVFRRSAGQVRQVRMPSDLIIHGSDF